MNSEALIDKARRLFAGDFPELQERFIAEVAEQRRADPLAPLVVMVPGHLAGLHLKRELARTGTSHANVHFETFDELTYGLAEPLLAERNWRKLPGVARGAIMKRAVESCGELSYFARMAGHAGFRDAAWATIQELRGAGLTADDLETAAKHPHAGDILQRKLADLSAIWRACERLLQRHRFADRAKLLDFATEAAAKDSLHTPLVIYGLDELDALERCLLTTVTRDRAVTAYVPFCASDAYAWSEPLYGWYLEQGFKAELLEPHLRAARADALTRVQLRVFEQPAPIPQDASEAKGDESLLVISAPSRDREAEEIVREILYPPSSLIPHPSSLARTAILMRESGNYRHLFRDECRRAGVTGYFHESGRLGDTPAGRALRSLTKLLHGEFRRADVMEFLLSSPLRPTGELPEIPATEWNDFARQAQIVAGEESWSENLRRLQHRITSELERREWEMDDPAAPLQKQLVSLAAFQKYLERLFAGIHRVREAKTWKQLRERVTALDESLVEGGQETDMIRAGLAEADVLDELGVRPDPEEFSSFVESVLAQPVQREGRFEMHEPAVATMAETLGVVFDDVYLCGLVEREFPRRAAQDPLLLDDERGAVQRALWISHPDLEIPRRERRSRRENFLFRVALNSARRRVILSYPRMDPVQGREWLPSTFLLRAVEAATGEATDYESLDRFIRTRPQARRISINRLSDRDAGSATTEFQYDLARLGAALGGKNPQPVAYLFCADAFFRRSVEAEQRRHRQRAFTPFDGSIEKEVLRLRLPEWVSRLSPPRMERYLECPFQYFASHVLDLETSAEPRWIPSLQVSAQGKLLHEILERFYRGERDGARLPLKEDAWPRLQDTAQTCLAEFETNDIPAPFLLRDIAHRKLLERLRAFFDFEVRQGSDFVPRYFRAGYGSREGDPELTRAEPVPIALASGLVVRLRGKLDRVDLGPDGHARVIDYSAKRKSGLPKRNAKPTLESHAARLAAEALGLNVDSFSYFFLNASDMASASFSREELEEDREEILKKMDLVAGHVAIGAFFPRPGEACRYCRAKAACGSGRFTRKWEFDTPQTESLRAQFEADS